MRATALLLTSLAAWPLELVTASDILARSIPGDRVLALNFDKQKHRGPGHSSRRFAKRTVTSELDNEYLLYYVDVQVGTPPQNMRLQIDTGSSDVWAPSANSRFCSDPSEPCNEGSYNPSVSTSRKLVSRNGFRISYLDGSHARGDFITEVFSIGNCTLPDLQMGIGEDTDITAGIMGIGYPSNSAAAIAYPGLVQSLVSNGFINSHAYSLWLNDQESNKGSILFGGIDTKKYVGDLIGLPIQLERGDDAPVDFLVALNSVGLVGEDGTETTISSAKLGAVLDCGSSLTYLPNSTVTSIVKSVGGIWDHKLEEYVVPCSLSNNHNEFVTFRFGGSKGPEIRIPMEELTNYIIDVNSDIWLDGDGNPVCTFGIQPQPSDFGDTYIFGDTFLRSAYVVYDLDGRTIWMAQTIFNATESNILEIRNSTLTESGVPDASGVESEISVTPTATTVQRPRPTVLTAQESATIGSGAAGTTSGAAESTQTSRPNAGLRVQVGGMLGLVIGAIGCIMGAMI
ncbi:hypothetical protein TWF730_002828 [Orbilia blumenaviensis]|uniref:Peptidase A1 domain-containing protein n=1 Tax=Orbilia blumenaviensis TaxID=1796055 RepID=A0AAV9U9I5_9PEZI